MNGKKVIALQCFGIMNLALPEILNRVFTTLIDETLSNINGELFEGEQVELCLFFFNFENEGPAS